MHIASWNVNGLRALTRKGALPWDCLTAPDVWCLQETKARPDQLEETVAHPEGWHAHWLPAEKAGYSGVAILSREEPDQIREGLGVPELDTEGRVLTACFGDVAVISAYFTNSQDSGKRLDVKLAFCSAMEEHLATLRGDGFGTVLCGDYNIAHKPIDLARPKANEQNPGYLPEERAWMDYYIDELGYHDVFREENPYDEGQYTWWSYRAGARGKNIGWRLDYTTVSPELRARVQAIAHHPEVMGSDHCPVSITLG